MRSILSKIGGLVLMCALVPYALTAQKSKKSKSEVTAMPQELYSGLEYRSLGPYRGGRSSTVTGVPGEPNLFYFGATGGGVWKTVNGGREWENISDGYFGGSIGAVEVAQSDPNVIYVGGGEKTLRGNVSSGYGIWKTVDAGRTWTSAGLKNSRHVPRIRIHPKGPKHCIRRRTRKHLYPYGRPGHLQKYRWGRKLDQKTLRQRPGRFCRPRTRPHQS